METVDIHEVVIVGRFPPPIDGQTMATRRLESLLKSRYAVHRITTSAPEGEQVAVEVKLRPKRVRYYLERLPRVHHALKELPDAPVLWTSVSPARLGHWRDMLATLPAFQPRQRVFGVLHRSAFQRLFQSSITAPTARHLVRRLEGFVFLDERLSEACAPWIPEEKRHVIPNTISNGVLCSPEDVSAKQAARSDCEELRLLFLSNMIPEKGYRDVLEAIRLLRNRNVPVQAVFAGRWVEENDRAAFERFLDDYDLHDRVAYRGSVKERGLIKRMHLEADVFVLPTYYPPEAQPLALLEALNAGTPAITTRHGGIPEIVREGREALFVPARNPEAIASAVDRLMDYPFWKQLSQGARKRFEEQYSPDTVRKMWERLIDS